MTNDLPTTPSQNSLQRMLKHIQDAGVPTKVDGPYLKSVGFKSGNDSYLVPVLKKIGFLSSSAVPETSWRSYKDKQRAPKVLAQGVLSAYADLFAVYPDAYRKDDEAIRNWVRTRTGEDEVKVGYAVATFKTLCALADFQGAATDVSSPADVSVPIVNLPGVAGTPRSPAGPSININIELQLPSSADGDTYEKFFAAMKKHLFPDEPGE